MLGTAMLTTEESIMDSIGPPRKASRVRVGSPAAAVPPGPARPRGRPSPVLVAATATPRGGLQRVQPAALVTEAVHAEVQHPQPPIGLRGIGPQRGQVGDLRVDDRPPHRDDLEPVGGFEIGEERDPHLELVVVGQQGGVGVRDHRLEHVVAGVGEAVNVPRRPARVRLRGHPLDRALLPETPQGGIEDVVVDRPPAQDPLDLLLDLIPVPRPVGEHAQHQYVEVHADNLIYVKLTRKPRGNYQVLGRVVRNRSAPWAHGGCGSGGVWVCAWSCLAWASGPGWDWRWVTAMASRRGWAPAYQCLAGSSPERRNGEQGPPARA